jgi:signal recognition particle subunit SRP54
MLTLIEQAQQTFDEAEAERMAAKLASGNQFTLEDFLEQLMAIRRMGPIGNLLGMLPGMGQMKEAISQVDDRDLDRIAAIIRSMTPAERQDPKIINGSRRLRIAKGSGVTVTEVNSLVDRFFAARKMMKSLGGAMPGMRRPKPAKGKKGKKGARGGARQGMPRALPGGQGLPGGLPGALPPGVKLPDLSKLNLPDR